MKKLFSLACLALPCLLFSEVAASPAIHPPLMQEVTSKGEHHKLLSLGNKVVKHFWELADKHKWHSLKKQIASDFRAQDTFGDQFTRSAFIQLLQELEISNVHARATYTQKKDNVLIVLYDLSFDSASHPTISFSGADLGVFVKKDGKWQWKTDSNLIPIAE